MPSANTANSTGNNAKPAGISPPAANNAIVEKVDFDVFGDAEDDASPSEQKQSNPSANYTSDVPTVTDLPTTLHNQQKR